MRANTFLGVLNHDNALHRNKLSAKLGSLCPKNTHETVPTLETESELLNITEKPV